MMEMYQLASPKRKNASNQPNSFISFKQKIAQKRQLNNNSNISTHHEPTNVQRNMYQFEEGVNRASSLAPVVDRKSTYQIDTTTTVVSPRHNHQIQVTINHNNNNTRLPHLQIQTQVRVVSIEPDENHYSPTSVGHKEKSNSPSKHVAVRFNEHNNQLKKNLISHQSSTKINANNIYQPLVVNSLVSKIQ